MVAQVCPMLSFGYEQVGVFFKDMKHLNLSDSKACGHGSKRTSRVGTRYESEVAQSISPTQSKSARPSDPDRFKSASL